MSRAVCSNVVAAIYFVVMTFQRCLDTRQQHAIKLLASKACSSAFARQDSCQRLILTVIPTILFNVIAMIEFLIIDPECTFLFVDIQVWRPQNFKYGTK